MIIVLRTILIYLLVKTSGTLLPKTVYLRFANRWQWNNHTSILHDHLCSEFLSYGSCFTNDNLCNRVKQKSVANHTKQVIPTHLLYAPLLIASVMIEGGWLTRCGLVTPYVSRHLGQHLFRSWHVAWMTRSPCFKLCCYIVTWWRHQMETFSALLALCAGNSPVPGEFPSQRPVTRSFHVYFDLRPNKRLSKQSWGWWFETLSHPLWRHCNELNHKENFGRIWIILHTFQLMNMSLSLGISKSIQH